MNNSLHSTDEELINSYGGLADAKARSDKMRGKYNRGGLSNTDYKELLRLEKAVAQAMNCDNQTGFVKSVDEIGGSING